MKIADLVRERMPIISVKILSLNNSIETVVQGKFDSKFIVFSCSIISASIVGRCEPHEVKRVRLKYVTSCHFRKICEVSAELDNNPNIIV